MAPLNTIEVECRVRWARVFPAGNLRMTADIPAQPGGSSMRVTITGPAPAWAVEPGDWIRVKGHIRPHPHPDGGNRWDWVGITADTIRPALQAAPPSERQP